jgi:hypothetical protein
MKPKRLFHLTGLFLGILLGYSLPADGQNYATYLIADTPIDSSLPIDNRIGAELPTDPSYYYKTSEGLDSVRLESYTIYHYTVKKVYTNPKNTIPKGYIAPYFKGVLKDGQMLSGELFYYDTFYDNQFHYKGSFKDNKAEGLGVFTITSGSYNFNKLQCKAIFSQGRLTDFCMVKTDFDSEDHAQLFYNGDVKLGYGLYLVPDGYGSYYRTGFIKPSHKKVHGLGVRHAYYEGQVLNKSCTGYGIFNIFDYEKKKTSDLNIGLLAADFPVTTFETLPFNVEDKAIGNTPFSSIKKIVPDIDAAIKSFFIYNGMVYDGMAINGKPYGFGIMKDHDGFMQIGFWKDGEKIPTYELLSNLLPDPSVLLSHDVVNKIVEVRTSYNSKKNKYISEEISEVKTIKYYGKVNSEGKIEGWGYRVGNLIEVGSFLPTTLVSDKKLLLPDSKTTFETAYTVKYGDGSNGGYGSQVAANSFYPRNGQYAEQTVPYGWINLPYRDSHTIALSEYRDKRINEVEGWQKLEEKEREKYKLKKEAEELAYESQFLKIENPTKATISSYSTRYFMDRGNQILYSVYQTDLVRQTVQMKILNTNSCEVTYQSFSIADWLSLGNFRPVDYQVCPSCGGSGIITQTYSYTADYEYTYGAKVKSTYTSTEHCGCSCGLVPMK